MQAELKVLNVYHREEVDSLFAFTSDHADRFKRDNDGQEIASGKPNFLCEALAPPAVWPLLMLSFVAGEQVWFLLKHGTKFDRGKLSRKMAWGLIDDYMKRTHKTDVRFFQLMEFYKVYGIGLEKTMGLTKARAEAVLTSMVGLSAASFAATPLLGPASTHI